MLHHYRYQKVVIPHSKVHCVLRWITGTTCWKKPVAVASKKFSVENSWQENWIPKRTPVPAVHCSGGGWCDLIVAGKEVKLPIARLAQLAQAGSPHHRHTTAFCKYYYGTIKANFLHVLHLKWTLRSTVVILDADSAEQLIRKGDILINYNGDIRKVAMCVCWYARRLTKWLTSSEGQRGYPDAFLLPNMWMKGNGRERFEPQW